MNRWVYREVAYCNYVESTLPFFLCGRIERVEGRERETVCVYEIERDK